MLLGDEVARYISPMKNVWLRTVIPVFCLAIFIPEGVSGFRRGPPKPLLEPKVINIPADRIDQTIESLHFTLPYAADVGSIPIYTGASLNQQFLQLYENYVSAIVQLVGSREKALSTLKIQFAFYGFTDVALADKFMEAGKYGAEINGFLHWGRIANTQYEGVSKRTDVWNLPLLPGHEADAARRLLNPMPGEVGFKFPGKDKVVGKLNLYTPPVFRNDSGPIFHLKQISLECTDRSLNIKPLIFRSSGNMTLADRINTAWPSRYPQIVEYYLGVFEAMKRAFIAGKEIEDMEDVTPVKLVARDGSFMLMDITGGKRNPHIRMSSFLDSMVSGNQFELISIYDKQLVTTHHPSAEATMRALRKFPKASYRAILDGLDADTNGHGYGATFEGYIRMNQQNENKPVYVIDPGLSEQAQVYVVSAPGINPETGQFYKEVDPTKKHLYRMLEHNKWRAVYYKDVKSGKVRVRLSIATFNLSNAFDNQESWELYDLDFESDFSKALLADFRGTLEVLRPRGYALTADEHLMKTTLSWLTSVSDLDIPLQDTQDAIKAILERDYGKFENLIYQIRNNAKIINKEYLSDRLFFERVKVISDYLSWYQKTFDQSAFDSSLRLQKLLPIIKLVGRGKSRSSAWIEKTLAWGYFRENLTPIAGLTLDASIREWIKQSWSLLGLGREHAGGPPGGEVTILMRSPDIGGEPKVVLSMPSCIATTLL